MKHYSLEFVGKTKKAGFKKPAYKKITIKLYYYSTKNLSKVLKYLLQIIKMIL